MKTEFYRCEMCGNVIVKVMDSGVQVECCGETMEKLVPQTAEAGMEKHLPVVTCLGEDMYKVEVGSVPHPMLDEHFIQFIYLETAKGGQIAYLRPGDQPSVVFRSSEKPTAVYEYCNMHGLWMTTVKK
ncbi:MAG: desulfoferrodoxin [Bacteroidales bacterium]|nr:desulfoferrodoxin [Bacteroidales bacterium]